MKRDPDMETELAAEYVVWLCHACEMAFEHDPCVVAYDCVYCGSPCENDGPARNDGDVEMTTDYERLRSAVEDALIVLDGYSGRVVDAAKVILRETLDDGSG